MVPIAALRICPLRSLEESKWCNQCQHTSLSSGCCSVHNPPVHHSDKNVVQCVLLIKLFHVWNCASHHTRRPHFISWLLMVSFSSYKMWELETTYQCCRDPSYGVGVMNFFSLYHGIVVFWIMCYMFISSKSNCQFFRWCVNPKASGFIVWWLQLGCENILVAAEWREHWR